MENNNTILSEIEPAETEATPLQGFLTRLLDFAIDILILFLIYKLVPRHIVLSIVGLSSAMLLIIVILTATLYRFLFLTLFNKTVGMMICRVKFLNKGFQPLSTREKLLSVFRTRFSPIKYYKEK